MKPIDLYKQKAKVITDDIDDLMKHIDEIDWYCWIDEGENTRIELHYYEKFCEDGRWCYNLASVKFDGEFIMVIQNAGWEGKDHVKRFITNEDEYVEMVSYIRFLIDPEEDEIEDLVDIDDDIENLTKFYGSEVTFEENSDES